MPYTTEGADDEGSPIYGVKLSRKGLQWHEGSGDRRMAEDGAGSRCAQAHSYPAPRA
jgi:hypothetical protein